MACHMCIRVRRTTVWFRNAHVAIYKSYANISHHHAPHIHARRVASHSHVRHAQYMRWTATELQLKSESPAKLYNRAQNTKGLFTLNPDSNRFSNWISQCEFNANPMRINHVIRIHTALCGTEFTRTRWLQVATPPHSYHGTLVRSLLQPAIILLLKLSRYMEHSV